MVHPHAIHIFLNCVVHLTWQYRSMYWPLVTTGRSTVHVFPPIWTFYLNKNNINNNNNHKCLSPGMCRLRTLLGGPSPRDICERAGRYPLRRCAPRRGQACPPHWYSSTPDDSRPPGTSGYFCHSTAHLQSTANRDDNIDNYYNRCTAKLLS